MKKVLDLVLIGKWYDLIADGIKREEYRAITPYWCNRLFLDSNSKPFGQKEWNSIFSKPFGQKEWNNSIFRVYVLESVIEESMIGKTLTIPTHVRFRRGYTNISMTYKIESISIGRGKSEWGAGADPCFIIKFK